MLDLKAHEGVSPDLAQTLTELLVVAVREADTGARVMGSSDVSSLLGFERQKALLGCQESSCLAELGGAMGAREIVSGSVAALGDTWLLVLRRLEVAKARAIAETSETLARGDAGKLPVAVRAAVARLYPEAAPAAAVAPAAQLHAAPRRARAWPWVLGAAALVGLASVAVGAVEYANWKSVHGQCFQTACGLSPTDEQNALTAGQVGVGLVIGGAVAAVGFGTGVGLTW